MGETPERVQQTVEFTYNWYADFLSDLQSAGYSFRSFDDDLGPGDLLLRHDVDLSLDDALTMARLEAAQNVTSTYFVLLTSPLYNLLDGTYRECIREIEALGHDVSLHFSTHNYWNEAGPPSEDELEARVHEELDVLSTITSTDTDVVSFHKPPSWVCGRSFESFESAYAPRFFDEIDYVADSRQRWRSGPPDVDALAETVQVLTHPGLWGSNDATFEECVTESVASVEEYAHAEANREFLHGGD